MVVAELMTPAVSGIASHEPLSKVLALMSESSYSCVLIVNGRHLEGIITERDLVKLFAKTLVQLSRGKGFDNVEISQVMTREPVCILEDTTLYDALMLARGHKLRHLPVVNNDEELVGLVTQTDMVNAYVQLMEKQSELEAANEELHLLSQEDGLLGIGNRRAMEIELAYTQASSKRYDKPYAVALIDVDYFKNYNDHYGHQSGDEALKQITNAVQSRLRDSDRLYRYGGEELLLVMPETDIEGATVGVERMRDAVESQRYAHDKSPVGYLTVSIGVASESDVEWADQVECADKALYGAKESGRNRACLWRDGQAFPAVP